MLSTLRGLAGGIALGGSLALSIIISGATFFAPPAEAVLFTGNYAGPRIPFAQPEIGMDYCRYTTGDSASTWILQIPPEWWHHLYRGDPRLACDKIRNYPMRKVHPFRNTGCVVIRDPNSYSGAPGWLHMTMTSSQWASPRYFEATLRIAAGVYNAPFECKLGFFNSPEEMGDYTPATVRAGHVPPEPIAAGGVNFVPDENSIDMNVYDEDESMYDTDYWYDDDEDYYYDDEDEGYYYDDEDEDYYYDDEDEDYYYEEK